MTDTVDLGQIRQKVQLANAIYDRIDQLNKDLAVIEAEIKTFMGQAEEAQLDGQKVFTYRATNSFRGGDFTKAHPDIAARFTIDKLKPVLDVENLRRVYPDLASEFTSRSFRRAS